MIQVYVGVGLNYKKLTARGENAVKWRSVLPIIRATPTTVTPVDISVWHHVIDSHALYLSYKLKYRKVGVLPIHLSDEGPTLETLDYTIRIGSTPTFLYFDLYLYSAYAADYVYTFPIAACMSATGSGRSEQYIHCHYIVLAIQHIATQTSYCYLCKRCHAWKKWV